MAAKSKLELLLELKNKMFNSKIMKTKRKFNKSVDTMRGRINKMKVESAKAFRAISDEFPRIGRGVDLLTNKYVLMASALAGIVLLYGQAGKSAASFNHEFLQIKQLNLDKNRGDLAAYKNEIRDTAFVLGADLNKVAGAFYDVQSATGLYGQGVKQIVKDVGEFSLATGADLNDSINATTKAMKAFGLETKDVRGLLASNAKTVQVGITTFKDLARVQTEYAGAAAGAGQTFDVANKIFAAFTSIAKDSNTAATMTKTAFEGLTQKSTVKGLREIGISLYNNNGQVRNLANVLEEVSGKFKDMSPKQIDALINKIGGPEGLRNLFVKLKTGADDFFTTLNSFDSSSFDLDKALRNAKSDVTVLGGIVKNRWNTVLAKLGERVLPTVARVLDKVDKGLVYLYTDGQRVLDWTYKTIAAFVTFKATTFALNNNIIKLAVSALPSLSGGLTKSTAKMKAFSASIKTNVIGIMVTLLMQLEMQLDQVSEKMKEIANRDRDRKKFSDNLHKNTELDRRKAMNTSSKDQLRDVKSSAEGRLKELQNIDLGLKAITNIPNADYFSGKAKRNKNLNAIEVAREELKQLQKIQNPSIYDKQQIAKKQDTIKQNEMVLTGGLSFDDLKQLIRKNKNIIEQTKDRIGDEEEGALAGTGGGTPGAEDITQVTGTGSAVRNITVHIDAFNKGGINTANTVLNKMSAEEIERWFNEAMLRVVRNLEISQ